MKKVFITTIIFAIFVIIACNKGEISELREQKLVLPEEMYAYDDLALPLGTNSSGTVFNDFNGNVGIDPVFNQSIMEITPAGATLGRVLFYDKKLSLNNTVSCGSCHHQDKAFTDGQTLSTGFEGRVTTRNTMAIVNPIVQNNMFWDSRSKTIHDLSLQPVQNHIEMGMEDLAKLESKLNNVEYYKPLFRKAFGSDDISAEKISTALSQFVGSITTSRSRFDQGMLNDFSNFTDFEKLGNDLFHSDKAMCSGCHGGGNFSALDGPFDVYGGGTSGGSDLRGATNIGLDLVYKDNGLGKGNFKIPSLRNIALTGPYMHDGRFNTLEQVLDHYTNGIKPHQNLDVKFTDGHGNLKRLDLSTIEKKAIIAFLKTLTDTEMTKDPKWSNPFQD